MESNINELFGKNQEEKSHGQIKNLKKKQIYSNNNTQARAWIVFLLFDFMTKKELYSKRVHEHAHVKIHKTNASICRICTKTGVIIEK